MTEDERSYPSELNFESVNKWVHETGRHYEELLFACLGLATEIDRLRAEATECDQLRRQISGILDRTANALKGDPGLLRRHSWHDLPAVAAAVRVRGES